MFRNRGSLPHIATKKDGGGYRIITFSSIFIWI